MKWCWDHGPNFKHLIGTPFKTWSDVEIMAPTSNIWSEPHLKHEVMLWSWPQLQKVHRNPFLKPGVISRSWLQLQTWNCFATGAPSGTSRRSQQSPLGDESVPSVFQAKLGFEVAGCGIILQRLPNHEGSQVSEVPCWYDLNWNSLKKILAIQ